MGNWRGKKILPANTFEGPRFAVEDVLAFLSVSFWQVKDLKYANKVNEKKQLALPFFSVYYPRYSMYGIFTYIWLIFMVTVNVGKYYITLIYVECLGMEMHQNLLRFLVRRRMAKLRKKATNLNVDGFGWKKL